MSSFSYTCSECKSVKLSLSSLNEKLDKMLIKIEESISLKLETFEAELIKIIDTRIEAKLMDVESRLERNLQKDLQSLASKSEQKFSSYSEIVKKSLREDVNRLKIEIENVKPESQGSTSTGTGTSKNELISEVVNKINNNNERRTNFVILHAPEEPTLDSEIQRTNDLDLIKKIFELCETPELSEKITKFHRLGRKPEGTSNHRPILVKLSDESLKRKLFKNLSKLRTNEDLKHILVFHDMSKEDREADKKRVVEAKEMSESSKKFLYKVRGPPWARAIVKILKN